MFWGASQEKLGPLFLASCGARPGYFALFSMAGLGHISHCWPVPPLP